VSAKDYQPLAKRLGAAHVLAKPFAIEELVAALAASLAKD